MEFPYHNVELLVVYENQRAPSSHIFRGSRHFSESALLPSDTCGPWSLPSGESTTKTDLLLPYKDAGRIFSEWVIDMNGSQLDAEGWQYAKDFDDKVWTESPRSKRGPCVRRRTWINYAARVYTDGQHFWTIV